MNIHFPQSIFAAVLVLTTYASSRKQPTVKLSLGEVRGYYKQSCGHRIISAFEGIPFAKPPLGELRFAEPQPVEPWTGIWNATVPHMCIQVEPDVVIGHEDCLYINVYVPRENPSPNENLDVIVQIHGGAFLKNPEDSGPDFLLDRDVIYVGFNYRLSVLGFASTGDPVVPGNNGMKDQVLALKWVQDHIGQFGGSPESVTIAGVSAGATSAHMHYFSPLSKGLFHRAISHSPIMDIQPTLVPQTRQVAMDVGCYQSDSYELIQCLRQRPASQLIIAANEDWVNLINPTASFGPVIEVKTNGSFLTDHPLRLLDRGEFQDVPWLVSSTTNDGIIGYKYIAKILDYVDANWYQIAPDIIGYDLTVIRSDRDLVLRKIKEFYFGDEELSLNMSERITQLFSDRLFQYHIEKSARIQAKLNKSPVYFYMYGYKAVGTIEALQRLTGIDRDLGVNHGADGYLIYNDRFDTLKLSCDNIPASDNAVKEVLLDVVTSFAKKGYPQVEGMPWEPINSTGDIGYLFIKGPGDVQILHKKELAPTDFWDSISVDDNCTRGSINANSA